MQHAALENGAVEIVEGFNGFFREHERDVAEAFRFFAEAVYGKVDFDDGRIRSEQLLEVFFFACVAQVADEYAAVFELFFVVVLVLFGRG